MSDATTAGVVGLRDGRRLAYRAIGPDDGTLVVYLHGALGSPQTACEQLRALTDELRLRYVMVSRPGFGGSDRAPGRTLRGFAGDLAQLADALGRRRFAIVGVSAGGPYALAAAHELPLRIAAAAVVSTLPAGGRMRVGAASLPRAARIGLRAIERWPRPSAAIADVLLRTARSHPRLVARVLHASAARCEREQLDGAGGDELAATRFLAATGGGIAGMIDDYLVCTRPWDFDPAEIGTPVQLWHGVGDAIVPVDAALHLAATLPAAQISLHPDEGHFFYRSRRREILGDLAATVRAAAALGQAGPASAGAPTRPAAAGSADRR